MIVERLKSFFDGGYTLNQRKIIINNAIDNIEALRAENAKLREALKPFANYHLSSEPLTTTLEYLTPLGEVEKYISHTENRDASIRAARAAMGETE